MKTSRQMAQSRKSKTAKTPGIRKSSWAIKERRDKAVYLHLIRGLNAEQIASEIGVDSNTIRIYIKEEREMALSWLDSFAATGAWNIIKDQINALVEDIAALRMKHARGRAKMGVHRAAIENAITSKQQLLKEYMEDLPLYAKFQTYEQFYETYKTAVAHKTAEKINADLDRDTADPGEIDPGREQ